MAIILVADDDPINRMLISGLLNRTEHRVVEVEDGAQALAFLQETDSPVVALIDWQMPEIEGIEVCRRARLRSDAPPMFLFVLTAREEASDVESALEAGADDYLKKPVSHSELLLRIKIGVQVVELQSALLEQRRQLDRALLESRERSRLLPICSYCRKVRNDQNAWNVADHYLVERFGVHLTHTICEECYEIHLKPQMKRAIATMGQKA